jgi:hypothetical protein
VTAPALEPVDYRIVADIVDALEAIATDHPTAEFFTDVESVHVYDQVPAEWNTFDLPTVVVIGQEQAHEYYDATGLVMRRLVFDFYPMLVREPETWRRDIYRLKSDVERAVLLDPRRGATPDGQPNAFDTTVLGTEVSNLVTGNGVAMARVSVAVDFRTSVTDPTQSG